MAIPSNSYIVFQAYGDEGIFHECALALLSLCQHHTPTELKNVQIWIYTDRPQYFSSFNDCWLNLHYREINQELLTRWRGQIDFVHRVKVCILSDFVESRQGQLLYLDTDVYFLKSVTEIFQNIASGTRYMHVLEDNIHQSKSILLKKLSRFIKRQGSLLQVKGQKIAIPPDTTMWNAGMLGFMASERDLLKKVLDFTDDVYKQFPKHIVEQYAFSIFLSQAATVLPAQSFIFHYWNLKELRVILQSFFDHFKNRGWDDLVILSKLIIVPPLVQEKLQYASNRSLLDRLRKRKWKPQVPDWDLLADKL